MTIKLGYIGFSKNPGFPESDIVTRFFKDGDRVTTDILEVNVLIIGDFVTEEEKQYIETYRGLRILYVAEPIMNMTMCSIAGQMFRENKYSAVIGCISNRNNGRNWVKYPIYRYSVKFARNSFAETNHYVSCVAKIEEKQFCTLINRHDWGGTRTPIYKEMMKMGNVVCPGRLHNNCSNEELNKMGNIEYIKKFIFNICSENFGVDHEGYITEKLMNACLGGAIPIYFGELDEVDRKIFNEKRILFLNKDNVEEVSKKIKKMMDEPEEMDRFYRQAVFCEGAYEEMEAMDENVMGYFDEVRKYIIRKCRIA